MAQVESDRTEAADNDDANAYTEENGAWVTVRRRLSRKLKL